MPIGATHGRARSADQFTFRQAAASMQATKTLTPDLPRQCVLAGSFCTLNGSVPGHRREPESVASVASSEPGGPSFGELLEHSPSFGGGCGWRVVGGLLDVAGSGRAERSAGATEP